MQQLHLLKDIKKYYSNNLKELQKIKKEYIKPIDAYKLYNAIRLQIDEKKSNSIDYRYYKKGVESIEFPYFLKDEIIAIYKRIRKNNSHKLDFFIKQSQYAPEQKTFIILPKNQNKLKKEFLKTDTNKKIEYIKQVTL